MQRNRVFWSAGVPVFSVSTGGFTSDFLSGFYGNVNNEIAAVCTHLRQQKELEQGFNLVGFSQGGQFSRAVVQRCRYAPSQCMISARTRQLHHPWNACIVSACGHPAWCLCKSLSFVASIVPLERASGCQWGPE